jgi:hypothetical protein
LLFTGSQEASSTKTNLLLNTAIMIPAFLLALLYPQVGVIAGYLGAFGTLFCIYLLPVATYLKMKHDGILPPTPGR